MQKILECGVCRDLLCEPVTLLCQHTFCSSCVDPHARRHTAGDGAGGDTSSDVKCPLCSLAFVFPVNQSGVIKEVLDALFPDQQAQRRQQIAENSTRVAMADKIRHEIRRDIFNATVGNREEPRWGLNDGVIPEFISWRGVGMTLDDSINQIHTDAILYNMAANTTWWQFVAAGCATMAAGITADNGTRTCLRLMAENRRVPGNLSTQIVLSVGLFTISTVAFGYLATFPRQHAQYLVNRFKKNNDW